MARAELPVFSHKELIQACLNTSLEDATRSGLATYREPFSKDLVGKCFHFTLDDNIRYCLRFPSVHELEWQENGQEFHSEYCECLASSVKPVYGIHFFRRHVLPYEGAFVVLDLETGCITWVRMCFSSDTYEKDVVALPHFGRMEGDWPTEGELHHFSNEYVGTIIDWQYSPDFTIRHSYISPTITTSAPHPSESDESVIGRRFLPAFQAKIRDGLLLTSFAEPGGCTAVLLIDLDQVHDIGCFYGISHELKLSSITLAAVGGLAGPALRDYTPPKHPYRES